MSKSREILLNPIFNDNPIALQILGICSALAVTTNLYPTLLMCIALTAVILGIYLVRQSNKKMRFYLF